MLTQVAPKIRQSLDEMYEIDNNYIQEVQPSQSGLCNAALSSGDRTMKGYTENNNPGVKKWYIHAEKCLQAWLDNGIYCAHCIAVCPYTEGFDSAARQCLQCERCLAPECPIQALPMHPRR